MLVRHYELSGKWIKSDLTGLYHYYTIGTTSNTDYNLKLSKCQVRKITESMFEDTKKIKFRQIPDYNKACKTCTQKMNLTIYDYIENIEIKNEFTDLPKNNIQEILKILTTKFKNAEFEIKA